MSMTQPKQAIKTKIVAQVWIYVYCDPEMLPRIKALSGVIRIDPPQADNGRCVWVDARYDLAEIAAEIEDLV